MSPGESAATKTRAIRIIDQHPTTPRIYFFLVVFSFPMILAVGYFEVSRLGPHPADIVWWFWGVVTAVSAGLGLLASIGFSSDIAREIEADERGLRVKFAARERFYTWQDVRPTGVVFPKSVRFTYSGGFHPFFVSVELARALVRMPCAPQWNLPPSVRRLLETPLASPDAPFG